MTPTLRMDILNITVSDGQVTGLNTGLERMWFRVPEYTWVTHNWTMTEVWGTAPPGTWVRPDRGDVLLEGVAVGYRNYDYGLFWTDVGPTLVANSHTLGFEGSFWNWKLVDTTFHCPVDGVHAMCTSGDTPATKPTLVSFARFNVPTNDVPEPGTAILMVGALGAAAWVRRRKSRQI